jgi:hypothetical protein
MVLMALLLGLRLDGILCSSGIFTSMLRPGLVIKPLNNETIKQFISLYNEIPKTTFYKKNFLKMAKKAASEQAQEDEGLELGQMNPFVTLSGAALALGYLNEFTRSPYSLDEFEVLAEICCNHTTATSGKNLQVKYLEWQYYNYTGHPHYLTNNLSNILMARARAERFEEALAVLKFVKANSVIQEVERDFALFMQNNPRVVSYREAAAAEKPKPKEKPYTDAADIFMILDAIEAQPEYFGLNNNIDALHGFISGYKLMATESKIKLKHIGRMDYLLFFAERELNIPTGKYPTWHALFSAEFGPTEGYTKFFEYLNKFKSKYKG